MLMILAQHRSHYELIKLIQLQDVIFQSQQSTFYTVMRENNETPALKSDKLQSICVCAQFWVRQTDIVGENTCSKKCEWKTQILKTYFSQTIQFKGKILNYKLKHLMMAVFSLNRIYLKPFRSVK